jgi:hypothetical protein
MESNSTYYLCYTNKDNKFIYKKIDKNKHCLLLDDFTPDEAEYLSVRESIPEYFHKSFLQMMYQKAKYFQTTQKES